MDQLRSKGIRVENGISILIDDASLRRERTKMDGPSSDRVKRWRRLPEEYNNADQRKSMEGFAQFMMDARMTKVVLLFGVANHSRFLDQRSHDDSPFRIESCGNLDPTALENDTVGQIYLLFHKKSNQLERILLMAQHPECTTTAGQRCITYRRVILQDLLLNLALALSFTPIIPNTCVWTASVEKGRYRNISDVRTGSIVAAAMDKIQQDICNFTITQATDSGCPQILQESTRPEYDKFRWLDAVIGQHASGHTVEGVAAKGFPNLKAARKNYVLLNRPKGFPTLKAAAKVAAEVNRAKGYPGLRAARVIAHASRRAAGYPGLDAARRVAVEVNRASGWANLKAALAVNRASGFQNTKGALKKAWEASRLSGYAGSKKVLERARQVSKERGHPGLQTARKNRIQERVERGVTKYDLVRPADNQPSRVARKCALCGSNVTDDEAPLYTREGAYVTISKEMRHEICACSHKPTKLRQLVPRRDDVKKISWVAIRCAYNRAEKAR